MKTKLICGGLLFAGLCLIALIVFLGLRADPASAQKQFSEEAQSWIQSIVQTSASWQKHVDAAKDLKIQFDAESSAVLTDEATARGLRQSLCSRYHLVVDAAGVTQEAASCPVF